MERERPHHEWQRVAAWLAELYQARFFGTVTLGIQNGECCTIETKSVTKPGEVLPVVTGKR